MKLKISGFLLIVFSFSLFSVLAQPKLSIDLTKTGINISPTQYGIFFEDINHAADGGLYAELIRNRSFEDAGTLDYWTVVTQGASLGTASIETSNLLNAAQTQALKFTVSSAGTNARSGITNPGFWGINLVKGNTYKLSFFAKCDNSFTGSIVASLESTAGVKYALDTLTGVGTGWQKFTCTLTPNASDATARLVLAVNSTGTLWFDVVSLFPPTFKTRENGLRPDLAQLLVDLNPKFMRFPGGCFVEGDYLANRFQWKKTIGKIEDRPGHSNLWGYRTSDGMGYHEFLQLCEDLNAAPLYVVNVGLSHNDNQAYTSLSGYIQDALDAIEYANGSVSSTYGALRAANGHPEPFNLKYIEIGNENFSGNYYSNRYLQFYNAIKTKYPDIQCIGNVAAWGTDSPTWTFSSPVDFLDEHYYRSPQWFINQYNKYDSYSRTGHKIYAGEYAVTSGCGNGNLSAAIGEAVYMAGMEKNSDMVPMSSYAPIFVNVNDRKWNPDMICYNASQAYCTPSYYVQKMFAGNIGTVSIPVKDTLNTKITPITGSVGLGTWSTVADYSNVTVTNSANTVLFSDQFANSTNWTPTSGTWAASGNIYTQSATTTDCRSIASANITDTTYTYSLKARKTSGSEGFLIIFGYKDTNNFYWWNIGGWGNTQHAIEQSIDGSKSTLTTTSGSIVTNQWYDIRIEVSKTKMLFYLNNTLIHTLNNASSLKLYTSATYDQAKGQLYLKVINPSSEDILSKLDFTGITENLITGESTVLTSSVVSNENTLSAPTAIVPVVSTINSMPKSSDYSFKANSVNILKLNISRKSEGIVQPNASVKDIKVYPGITKDYVYVHKLNSEKYTINVVDTAGHILIKKQASGIEKLDLSRQKSGVYFIRIKSGDQLFVEKVIKD